MSFDFQTINKKQVFKYVALGIGAIVLLNVAGHVKKGFQTVASDELGVVRQFGVVQPEPLKPGLHYIAPWQKLEKVTLEFSDLNFTDSGDGETSTITALTKDGFTVTVPVSVSWAINPETLTFVKARQPGYYTDREYIIVRSAVRNAMQQFSVNDNSAFDREKVQPAITGAIIKQTAAYYEGQGFGANSDRIVRYGLISVRGIFPSDDILAKREQVLTAHLEAVAAAARTEVPSKRSVQEYTQVLQAQAVSNAARDGKANVTVVSGNVPVVATAGGPKQ